jgi:cobalamin biosynthesis protein CobT
MTTSILTSLMRLGAELFGTNEDLAHLPKSKKDKGEGDDSNDDNDTDGDDESNADGEDSGDQDGDESDGSDGDSEDGDQDGDGSGDSEEGSDDGDSDDGDSDDGDSDSEGGDSEGGDQESDSEGEQTDDVDPHSDKNAGGHDFAGEFAEALIDGLKAPNDHILDGSDALEQATDKCRDEDDCEDDEQVWRPYDPESDPILKPKGNRAQAEVMRKEAKIITAALRTQFRRRFLAAKNPRVQHGVKRGKDLSERRLVESFIEIKAGVRPSRPDYKIEAEHDVSLALGVVIDESGSMQGREQHAAGVAALALAESFDSMNAPVMVCGPRNGGRGTRGVTNNHNDDYYYEDSHDSQVCGSPSTLKHHRMDAVVIDLFKDWNESFKQTKHRFASVQATGSTPLSDGIQFAMQELNTRPERHRIIIVLTDGCPDNQRVVRRQIRLAREAGITIIGVGISGAEYYLPQLFVDHHIVVENLIELPKRMMEVVGAIVFPQTAKKAALDGRVGSKRQRRRA